MTPPIRVGQGFDIHRFGDDPARPLVLGGVRFEGHPGLVGHSDADVVAHAVAEAILGATGLGNLGEHFPDTDPRWSGVDSLELLRAVAALAGEAGWEIGNVDCSVVCEVPKLAPRRDEMQQRLSEAAGAPVTVKGRRAEGMGAIGRSEGVACWAVALVTATAVALVAVALVTATATGPTGDDDELAGGPATGPTGDDDELAGGPAGDDDDRGAVN